MTRHQSEPRVGAGLFLVFGLAWASGLIHVQAASAHSDVSGLEAVLFALLATAQFLWGAAVYREASAALLWAGAAGSVLVADFWAMSRVTGIPFGPDPWSPEPIGLLDVLATTDELLLALLVVVRMQRTPRAITTVLSGAAIALILMSSLSMAGGAGHVH
jgi:hypothetical protein